MSASACDIWFGMPGVHMKKKKPSAKKWGGGGQAPPLPLPVRRLCIISTSLTVRTQPPLRFHVKSVVTFQEL